jgi:mono/diheme cytochrome c family protein
VGTLLALAELAAAPGQLLTMKAPRLSRLETRDFPLMVVLSLAFFALVAAVLLRERDSEWRPLQTRFAAILEDNGQAQAARELTRGVRQIWLPELGRVDRCPTCHLGYDWSGTLPADLPEPFTPHPALPFMGAHPFDEFGCTSCHGGQGFATEKRAAHGEVEHWDEPLLSRQLAAQVGVPPTALLQMRCNACHRREVSTDGMETLNRGKDLFRKGKCVVCHVVDGRGGLAAPELTYIGDKAPELFDFTHVPPPHTALHWHEAHLTSAQTVSPGTTMPTFDFPPDDSRALALLLLSWRRQSFPPRYLPQPTPSGPAAAGPALHQVAAAPDVAGAQAGRAVFLAHGCNTCHSVGGGVVLGPDLKGVGSRRQTDWLRRWLADPAAMIRAEPDLREWPASYGNVVMPNQNLSMSDIDELVTYLGKL